MPTMHRIGRVEIRIYRRGEHNPPHIHVVTRSAGATIRIDTGAVLRGALPPKIERSVRRWLADNRAETLRRWHDVTGL